MKVQVKVSKFCERIGFEKCLEMNGQVLDASLKKDKRSFPPYHSTCQCVAVRIIKTEHRSLRFSEAVAEMKRRGTFYRRRLQ